MSDLQQETQQKKKSLTRAEIISKINCLTGVSNSIIKSVITEYENTLLLDLAINHETKIGPIGKVKIKEKKSRISVNPKTGEKIIIESRIVPKFVFSKGLKEYISKKIKLNKLQ